MNVSILYRYVLSGCSNSISRGVRKIVCAGGLWLGSYFPICKHSGVKLKTINGKQTKMSKFEGEIVIYLIDLLSMLCQSDRHINQ
jgi:hypothetical protein